jgi:hypothetical protein
VQQLTRVFLDMEASDAYLHSAPLRRVEADAATGGERPVELRDLVPLGQIGIEIVLPGEDAGFMHRASQREGAADRQTDRLGIGDG